MDMITNPCICLVKLICKWSHEIWHHWRFRGTLPHLEVQSCFCLSASSWYFWKLITIIWFPFNIPETIADQCYVSFYKGLEDIWMDSIRYVDNVSNSIFCEFIHYCDVIMGAVASQITSVAIVYSTQIKGNIKAPRHWPLCGEFTGDRWIPRLKWPVTRKMFPFDDVIMSIMKLTRLYRPHTLLSINPITSHYLACHSRVYCTWTKVWIINHPLKGTCTVRLEARFINLHRFHCWMQYRPNL